MSILVGGYVSARSCTGSSRFGNLQFMAWYLGVYGSRGARNLGIYDCDTIPGSDQWSVHSEGRADDLGLPVGQQPEWAQELADDLVDHSAELGIQCVIYNRHIWSSVYPFQGWRPYNGSNPHVDHIHMELTPSSAATLTIGNIAAVLGGTTPPIPSPVSDWTSRLMTTLPTLQLGASGRHVRIVQAVVGASVDGSWGPLTDAAVRRWEVSNSVPNSVRQDGTGDGIWGPACWQEALLP